MLHHISFAVSNIERSAAFYDAVLAKLGYRRVFTSEEFIGYGIEDGKDMFAIVQSESKILLPEKGFHLALSAPSRESVDAFHKAAIESGGQDNGGPSLRPHYGDQYYAAFVIDPDGYHVEAVINQ